MKNFDFSSKKPYIDLLNNLAYYPSGREQPTQFNNDRTKIYLASLDIDIETDNVKHLESAIDGILSSYKDLLFKKGTADGDLKLAIRRCDFNEVALLLHNLKNMWGDYEFRDNTNYAYPDELFEELINIPE